MNTNHSSASLNYEYQYQPTIMESRLLIKRLAIQVAFLLNELKQAWSELKKNPVEFTKRVTHDLILRVRRLLSTPNALPACLTSLIVITSIVMAVILIDRRTKPRDNPIDSGESPLEVVFLDAEKPSRSEGELRTGMNGPGRVGYNRDKGEGSGESPKRSQGGGGGGDGNPIPPQVGKIPPPSEILAAIPTAPPVHPPTLPVAGIDIDPALWKDLKAPVYGDPGSTSQTQSKGPGEGEGIGTNKGLGIGPGLGPGVGPGTGGNTGGGSKTVGCCGVSGGSDDPGRPLTGAEVEQRARLLLKPEPQYTEEARRNQTTGTVVLRVVFSSAGEVVQIRATRTLPFGLTERAIAAARQIKFVPAMKGGKPVSVFMQLEYNFNLY